MKRLYVLCAVLLMFTAPTAFGVASVRDLTVPGDFGTIQEAVNAAEPGAIITVAPGTYWSRVHVADPIAALLVRRALDEAHRVLAETRCQSMLEDFQDAHGRSLRERLALLHMDVQRYLDFVVFVEATRPCTDTLAYTAPGNRVVYLCVRAIERLWRDNPDHVVASLIHEMLHTLGLGENPPSSSEITERVIARCLRSRPPTP